MQGFSYEHHWMNAAESLFLGIKTNFVAVAKFIQFLWFILSIWSCVNISGILHHVVTEYTAQEIMVMVLSYNM